MDGDEKAYGPDDFRFTYRGGCVYAFQMRPDGAKVQIRSMAEHGMYDFLVENVSLMGWDKQLTWQRTYAGLEIEVPSGVNLEFPLCFRIRLA